MVAVSFQVDKTAARLLEKRLDAVPIKLRHNLERRAMREALKDFRKAARAGAPKRSGKLRKSIVSKVSLKRGKGLITGRIYVERKKRKVYYAHLVEWGTSAFSTRAPMKASLFMTRTFEAHAPKIFGIFRNAVHRLIAEQGRR